MKKIYLLFGVACAAALMSFSIYKYITYDSALVQFSAVKEGKGDDGYDKYYRSITMSRSGERVRAKYFAAKEGNTSVYQRYSSWKNDSPRNIILFTSGTYVSKDDYSVPDGFTIDDGRVVNERISNSFDGFVIVYATGGVVATNLKEGNLKIKCNGVDRMFNLKNDDDFTDFVDCAKRERLTAFQTHLLVYKSELKIKTPNTHVQPKSGDKRERRFLALCKKDNVVQHVIVHREMYSTLFDATNGVYDYLLNIKDMDEVIFMINLDTGYQDIFQAYDNNGYARSDIKGRETNYEKAANLLVYYYE